MKLTSEQLSALENTQKIVIKIVFMEQMAHVADPSTLNLPENRMTANNNDLERRK